MDRKELTKILEEQIEVESAAIRAYEEAMGMIDNFAYSLVFESMLMDSRKHKKMFEVIKQTLALPPSVWDLAIGKRIGEYIAPIELKKHVKLEEDMIKKLPAEIKAVDNATIKHLLEHVLEDENRHHSVLKKLIEKL